MPAPYREAAERPVGPVVSVHPWKSGPGWLIGVMFLGFFAYIVSIAIRQRTWTGSDTLGLVFMSAVTLGLAGLMFWIAWITRGDHATIHEDALVVRRRGKTTTLPFDRIRSLSSRVETRGVTTIHRHTIEDDRGEKIVFSQILLDIDGLVERLEARLGTVVVTRIQEALDRGDAVDFRKFELRPGRVVLPSGDELLFAEARVDTEGGLLTLRRSGSKKSFASFLYADVPNAFVLPILFEGFRTAG